MAQVYRCQESPRPGRRNAGTVRVKRKGNERASERGRNGRRMRERGRERRGKEREGGRREN